jgi:hypothetical protein
MKQLICILMTAIVFTTQSLMGCVSNATEPGPSSCSGQDFYLGVIYRGGLETKGTATALGVCGINWTDCSGNFNNPADIAALAPVLETCITGNGVAGYWQLYKTVVTYSNCNPHIAGRQVQSIQVNVPDYQAGSFSYVCD